MELMSATSAVPLVGADTSGEVSPASPRSKARVLWRLMFASSLLLLVLAWIWSWDHLGHRSFPNGRNGCIEIYLAGSSAAINLSRSGDSLIDFGSPTGPLGSGHLLPYHARWSDGDSLGEAANPCVSSPWIDSVRNLQLDRVGSFGGGLGWPGEFHLRLPVWTIALALLIGWFAFERRLSSRRREELSSSLNFPTPLERVRSA